MAKQTIGLGASPNDGTGDSLRVAFDKANDNFDELYARGTVLESTVLLGAAVSLTDNTPTDVTSLVLPVGVWEVDGVISLSPNPATTMSVLRGWISPTSATFPTPPNGGAFHSLALPFSTGSGQHFCTGRRIITVVSGTTQVYLSTRCGFAVNTLAAYGHMTATRIA